MAQLRLFGPAREAAGTGSEVVEGQSVAAVLAEAERRFGPRFAEVLATSKVWLNGSDTDTDAPVGAGDEVAVLPPCRVGADATPGRGEDGRR